MGTITINVLDNVENEFRKIAGNMYKFKKGYLGKAITDAMEGWLYRKKQKKIADELMGMSHKGFKMGKILYKNRDDLHGR